MTFRTLNADLITAIKKLYEVQVYPEEGLGFEDGFRFDGYYWHQYDVMTELETGGQSFNEEKEFTFSDKEVAKFFGLEDGVMQFIRSCME
ncbi:hypothetical protein ACJU26_08690 [Acidithiobacillus sp. M4-SHS-6]|uniref:hypothetical protein n=1 Tax=Acidithiobacillus sp. M4-SHS-6 TaxID=3383024 RepID=UPI0039BE62DF